ncbi:hypothetical protein ES703_98597 [subsurface metagenome]
MTTIEIKGKGVPEILDEKKALAAKGSCKMCQFCLKGYSQGMEYHCAIQGIVNTISFTEAALNSKPYPYGPCDDGNWTEINDDDTREQIYGCLAYMPKLVENVSYRDDLVTKHRAFMHCLAEGVNLQCTIEDAHSGKAQAKLDELLRRLNTGDFSGYSLY